MSSTVGGHREAPRCLKHAVWFLLLLVPFICLQVGSAAGDITLTTTVTVADISSTSEIWLARLTADPGDPTATAIGLRWAKDATSWFPTWQLQLASSAGLTPADRPTQKAGSLAFTPLGPIPPVAGHAYDVTLSYSASLGALSIKVYDATDRRTVYADGVSLPAFEPSLRAVHGDTAPYYIPAGSSLTLGIAQDGGTFLPLSQFEKSGDKGALRLVSSAPYPPGEYRVTLEHNGIDLQIANIQPNARETIIPLPMLELPLGRSALRVDYLLDGDVLTTEALPLTFGRVDFWMQPVVAERAEGVLKTSFEAVTPEAISDILAVEVRASIDELVWDEGRRQFKLIPYSHGIPVHETALDLSATMAQFAVEVPLPDRHGNWRVQLTPYFPAEVAVRSYGNERQFSTHLPADVNPGDEYTIVVLPDTQYFARSYPDIFTRMTDWITANAAEMGIAAVLHVGDITDNNSPIQWENAYASMSLLHDVVPYVFAIGNHDMVAPNGSAMRGHTRVNTYFPADMAERYSNLAGTMVPGRMENYYSLLSIAGTDYLVLSLEFWPTNEALAWANDVAAQYPDHKLIYLTHSFTSSSGGLALTNPTYPITQDPETTTNSAVAQWELFLRRSPNSLMAISGHTSPSVPVVPHRITRNIAGQPVTQLLFDWQNQPNGGNGWLGLITFKPDDTAEVKVMSPYLGEYANERDGNGHTSHVVINLGAGTAQRLFAQ